jgi:hypothetical protein
MMAVVSTPDLDHDALEAEIERVNDELATRLVADDRHGAETLLDQLRELAWQRRAATVRGRRQRGPEGLGSDGETRKG